MKLCPCSSEIVSYLESTIMSKFILIELNTISNFETFYIVSRGIMFQADRS